MRGEGPGITEAEIRGMWPQATECRPPSEARKDKEETNWARTLTLALLDLFWTPTTPEPIKE